LRLVHDKTHLRARARSLVAGLSAEYRRVADARICSRIMESSAYAGCEQVFVYSALSDEVALDALIAGARAAGKSVYLPVMDAGSATIRFALWSAGETLVRGAGGVAVPPAVREPAERPSLIVVPGRAFDRRGYRLGRGLGCYDRALGHLSILGPTIGAAYACQIVEHVPRQAHDRPVAWVVTEEETIHAEAARRSG